MGREALLAAVIRECTPDIVVFQEASRPEVIARLAAETGMPTWAADSEHSVAFMSRLAIAHHQWHRPTASRRAFLEIVPDGTSMRIFGLHLSAIHSNWTERRRVRELQAVLEGIERHQHGFHVLTGDFNTLAPGETLDLRKLPARLRTFVYLTGRQIRWQTVQIMLDASYVDAFRALQPEDPGYTFPTWDPHVRLDYVFLPRDSIARLKSCAVFRGPGPVSAASDHLPLLAEIDPA